MTVTPGVVTAVRLAHAQECALIGGLTDDQLREESTLPGWTRGHVLGARLVFARAALRQIGHAYEGGEDQFYDGGRAGRDAAIEADAARPATELVEELRLQLKTLDAEWSRAGAADWDRPVTYRGPGTLSEILFACWRESQLHRIDLRLGVSPSEWPAEFCAHLFDFLGARAPEGVRIDLTTPDGRVWTAGSGEEAVVVRGALTDLAAWLSGRQPDGALESSTGEFPELRRMREAYGGGKPYWA